MASSLQKRQVPSMSRRTQQRNGFTLIETMVVVVVIGILAALAVYSVRKYVLSAKSSEARQMLLAIKAAEEAYRDETYVYRSASPKGVESDKDMFPQICSGATAPAQRKYAWEQPDGSCADASAWRELGVTSTNPVQYGYAVKALQPNDALPKLGAFVWNMANAPGWAYVVVARADLNGNGALSLFLGSSFTDEIYVENEDE